MEISPAAAERRRFFRRPRCLFRQLEIHLAFESIHLGNLHLEFIAQFDDPARPASDQLAAVGIELKKFKGNLRENAVSDQDQWFLAHVCLWECGRGGSRFTYSMKR